MGASVCVGVADELAAGIVENGGIAGSWCRGGTKGGRPVWSTKQYSYGEMERE